MNGQERPWPWNIQKIRSIWMLNQRMMDRWDQEGFAPFRVFAAHVESDYSFPYWT